MRDANGNNVQVQFGFREWIAFMVAVSAVVTSAAVPFYTLANRVTILETEREYWRAEHERINKFIEDRRDVPLRISILEKKMDRIESK